MASGGELIARVLARQNVPFLFTLCGGHISPILVEAKRHGIRVIDVRDEATAVFAADAVSRLTGVPGGAAVTAGPGVVNGLTALKNAQLAQSALVVLGGATATFLKGRGALQDIDQMAAVRPHVKWSARATSRRDLAPLLAEAFRVAMDGPPGPAFVECPVDLLYDEALVREWYAQAQTKGKTLFERGVNLYLDRHVHNLFSGDAGEALADALQPATRPHHEPPATAVAQAAALLARAERPVLVMGSQAMLCACEAHAMDAAVERLGMPVYLAGTARGLLGPDHRLQMRHRRKEALREADLVVLAGAPCDFRLDYGRDISGGAKLIAANLDAHDVRRNRRPTLGVVADPGRFLIELARAGEEGRPVRERDLSPWIETLRARDDARQAEIARRADEPVDGVNPLRLAMEIDRATADDSVVVVDGGDFVATTSYVVRPRGPLRWLDPGVFGTLGVGAGFALGAKLVRPDAEVWLLYGDGSAAYSIAEFDTFVRHGLPVIAVVGNDGAWSQIARDQIELLHDDVGTRLRRTDYHLVAEGYGGKGSLLTSADDIATTLREAKRLAAAGHPVLINAHIGQTDFRKGSLSI